MSTLTAERATITPPTSEQLNPRRESIFEYYDVPNEIDFLRQSQERGVSKEDRDFYIEENIYRFLGEFAGKVPYTSITYNLEPDGLRYAGINLQSSYESTAALAGSGSREEDELAGHNAIIEGLEAGANVVQVSPAKIAPYGFAFYFQQQKDSNHVKEYILRYDEPLGSTSTSQRIQNDLDASKNNTEVSSFLRNPTRLEPANQHDELAALLRTVGVSEKDIVQSARFEERTRAELAPYVGMYLAAVDNGNVPLAKTILNSIYNGAVEIAHEIQFEIDGKDVANFNQGKVRAYDGSLQSFVGHYGKKSAHVENGGSCPVTRKNSKNPLAPADIATALQNGITSENLVHGDWDFDKSGTCRLCKEEFTEEQAHENKGLGPCAICRGCQDNINEAAPVVLPFEEENFALAA
jgi:hypothetical protein